MLSIVGLQWPEDSDCSQFPEEGGNTTCLLPEAGVDGTLRLSRRSLKLSAPQTKIFCLMCVSVATECSPSHFKCRSGRCVLASKRCDGHLDCDDHSDEDNCGESSRPLRPHPDKCFSSLVQQVMISPFCASGCSERALWECPGSTVCIKASMICDGFPDCPQLVDETNCCKTP